jgi:hypothetical protein
VLVVAGFGHVIQYALESWWKKNKTRRKLRTGARGALCQIPEKDPVDSSAYVSSQRAAYRSAYSPLISSGFLPSPANCCHSTSIKAEQEQVEQRMWGASGLEMGYSTLYFAMDVGDDERVRRWPAFAGMSEGRALIRMTPIAFPPQPMGMSGATTPCVATPSITMSEPGPCGHGRSQD